VSIDAAPPSSPPSGTKAQERRLHRASHIILNVRRSRPMSGVVGFAWLVCRWCWTGCTRKTERRVGCGGTGRDGGPRPMWRGWWFGLRTGRRRGWGLAIGRRCAQWGAGLCRWALRRAVTSGEGFVDRARRCRARRVVGTRARGHVPPSAARMHVPRPTVAIGEDHSTQALQHRGIEVCVRYWYPLQAAHPHRQTMIRMEGLIYEEESVVRLRLCCIE